MSTLQNIKKGVLQGIGFVLFVWISTLAYATYTWVDKNDSQSGDTLTSWSWNEVIQNQKYLKQEIQSLASLSSVPTWAVMAFNLSSCPAWWSEYTLAYGRFIRGIDKSWTSIDPDWQRSLWNIQNDEFKTHNHNFTEHHTVNGNLSGGSNRGIMFWWNAGYWGSSNYSGGIETRPDNIALLYCVKN